MPMLELICPVCKEPFKRWGQGVMGGTYCCSIECRKGLTQKDGKFKCRGCQQWLPGDAFPWYEDSRYSKGVRRVSYCQECGIIKARNYHSVPKNKITARVKHEKWRETNLSEGGDRALRWYFARQMGGYRKRAQKFGLSIDITPDFMVSLFHLQEGRCYYTGEVLDWNSYGKKHPSSDSMSVDRKDPTIGYVKTNVVLCTYRVNTMKGRATEEQFIMSCRNIIKKAERRGI